MLSLQGRVHAHAAALLPSLLGGVGGEAGPGLGLGVADEAGEEAEGRPAADLVAERLGGAGQADGVLVAALPPGQVGQAEDSVPVGRGPDI
jgi:hypothetical protein